MLVKFMVGYVDPENAFILLTPVFDSLKDANEYAVRMEEEQPAFVFMACRVVPALADHTKAALIAACKDWKDYMKNNLMTEDNISWDNCLNALDMAQSEIEGLEAA